MRILLKTLFAFFILLIIQPVKADTLYVNKENTALQDGKSWPTAFTDIQKAIDAANEGDEIWIARGEYNNPGNVPYIIKNSLSFYGGFIAGQISIDDRDLIGNKTTLTNYETDSIFHNTFNLENLHSFKFRIDGFNLTKSDSIIYTTNKNLLFENSEIKIKNCNVFNLTNTAFTLFINGKVEIESCEFSSNFEVFNLQVYDAILKNCKFYGNKVKLIEGKINNDLKLFNCSFKENKINYGLDVQGEGNFLLNNCNFSDNIPFDNYTSKLLNIYLGGQQNYFNSKFSNNKQFTYLIEFKTNDTISIKDSDFNQNQVSSLIVENSESNSIHFLCYNSNFTNNTLTGSDLLYIQSKNATEFQKTKFDNNVSIRDRNNSYLIRNKSNEFKFIDCFINKCIFNFLIHLYQNPISAKIINVNNCKIINCNIFNCGIVTGKDSKLSISNCTIFNNSFSGWFVSGYGKINIDSCSFNQNIFKDNIIRGDLEGLEIKKSLFTNNTINEHLIYNVGDIVILKSSFIKNTINKGNLIYKSNSGRFEISSTIISKNTFLGGSGIISIYGGPLVSENSIFSENIASSDIIFANISGAPFNSIYTKFTNCLFYRNISTSKKEVSLFGANKLYNCIFWNNSHNPYVNDFDDEVVNCNIQDNISGKNNLDVDPKFIDPENGDFRLSCDSPLLNKGSNDYVSELIDLDGNPRIVSDTVDIGPYEFQGDPKIANAVPVPTFTFSNFNPCLDEEVRISNTTINKEYFKYTWDKGDSTNLISDTSVALKYSSSKDYNIKLIATNACGKSKDTSLTIKVKQSLVPDIYYASSVCGGDTLTLRTHSTCADLLWTIKGGIIVSGQGTNKILVKWGDGQSGHGNVKLQASGCGNSNACELPIEITIPIFPAEITVKGKTIVCPNSVGEYISGIKDFVPGAVYIWRIKGGKILSDTSGYRKDTIKVQWNSNDSVGMVFLDIHHELLPCTVADSILVNIKPEFKIYAPSPELCINSEKLFNVNQFSNFKWNIEGSENTIDNTGLVNSGNIPGKYLMTTVPVNSTLFCNAKDTASITIIGKPVIDSISGDNEVNTVDNYQYKVNYTGASSTSNYFLYNWSNYINQGAGTARWNGSEPFGFKAVVKTVKAECASDTVYFPVKKDFVYKISAPDTVCISTSHAISINKDTLNPASYTWKLNGIETGGNTESFLLEFTRPGWNTLNAEVIRKGKTYQVSRNIYVNSAPYDISLTGQSILSPNGGGTYSYKIKNPYSLTLNYQVKGAVSYNLKSDSITVTWNQTGPYKLDLWGTMAGATCTSVHQIIVPEKAPAINAEPILSSGSYCLNTTAAFKVGLDQYASNIKWSLSGGGAIVESDDKNATVQWGNIPGEYELTINYQRFGIQTIRKKITLQSLPSPDISDEIICEGSNVTLTTTKQYTSYLWTLEPDGNVAGNSAAIEVSKGGYYKVTVSDINGCKGSNSELIRSVPVPVVRLIADAEQKVCPDAGTKQFNLYTVEGAGYNYQWFEDNIPAGSNEPVFTVNQDLSAPGTHTYKLLVKSETCSTETSRNFTVLTPESCSNNNGGGGDTTGTGGGTDPGNGGNGGEPCKSEVSFSVTGCSPVTILNTSAQENGFSWNFGDNTTSDIKQPGSHSFTDIGIYTISLRNGCAGTSKKIEVPVLARFNVPAIVCQGAAIEFKDFSVNLPQKKITSWSWNFGDGKVIEGTGSGSRDITHKFEKEGEYTVSLTVRALNSAGSLCHNTYTTTIKVNPAPVIDFSVKEPACNSTTFIFTDKSSISTSDARYDWSLDEGFTSGAKNAAVTYKLSGQKNVSLKVTDYLKCSAQKSVTVVSKQPVEAKEITLAGKTSICNGDSVLLTSPLSENGYTWFRNGNDLQIGTQNIYAKIEGEYSVEYIQSDCRLQTKNVTIKRFHFDNTEIKISSAPCIGEKFKISIPGTDSYNSISWRKDNIGISNFEFIEIENLTPENSGKYSAIVTERATGCTYVVPEKLITVNSNPSRPNLQAKRAEICFLDSSKVYPYSPNTGVKYSWFVNSNLSGINSDTLHLNSLERNSSVSLQITDSITGCTAKSDEVTIKVGLDLKPVLSGNINVCERTNASVSVNVADNEYSYNWYKGDSLLPTSLARLDFLSISPGDTGNYHAVITSSGINNVAGCKYATDTVNVSVKKAPLQAQISGQTEFCEGSSVVLTSSVTQNISWNTGQNTPSVRIYREGAYNVTATDLTSGCKTKSSVFVKVNPLPDLSFVSGGLFERCSNKPIDLLGLNSYSSFQWKYNGVNVGKAGVPYAPRNSGNYTVAAVTDKGCKAESDTMRIKSILCGCIVTLTEDSDEPGTLREAIKCANKNPGIDNIIFEIPGNGPFTLAIDSVLPAITEGVIIDGFTQSGTGKYDIQITGGKYTKSAFVINPQVTQTEINGLQFDNFSNSINAEYGCDETQITNNKFSGNSAKTIIVNGLASNIKIQSNTFESSGTGNALDLSFLQNSIISANKFSKYKTPVTLYKSTGNTISGNNFENITSNALLINESSDNNLISSNSFTYIDSSSIVVSGSENNRITGNKIGLKADNTAGTIGKYGIRLKESPESNIQSNQISSTNSHAILAESSSGTSITENKIGIIKGAGGDGIKSTDSVTIIKNTISNSSGFGINIVENSEIKYNVIENNKSGGIYVGKDSVLISRNTISNTDKKVKAIDLHGSANKNKKPADFQKYQLNDKFIIISGKSLPSDSVEIFLSENAPQQALKYISTIANKDGNWTLTIPKGPFYTPDTRNYYVNTATSGKRTSELSGVFETGCFNCKCTVINSADAGQGSLRTAIDSAHAGVCRYIDFSMESASIKLDSALRNITVPLIIQGNDKIAVIGKGTGTGLKLSADKSSVSKIEFRNWGTGLEFNSDSSVADGIKIEKTTLPVTIKGNNNTVENVCINCDTDTINVFTVTDGIVIKGNNNTIGNAGKGNTIIHALSSGIKVDSSTGNKILYNKIPDSEKAIRHINKGNNNYPAPNRLIGVLTDSITAKITGKANAGDRIQLFISDYTGRPAGTFITDFIANSDNWSVPVPPQFLNKKENTFVVITATDKNGNTSEISKPVKIGNKPTYCYVTNTLNSGKGSLRSAVDCANEAGKGQGAPAEIIFRLPGEIENTITVADSGFILKNNYGIAVDPGNVQVKLKPQSTISQAFRIVTGNNKISNLNLENFITAVKVENGSNNEISVNTFAGNDTAISINHTGTIKVTENTITKGKNAIVLNEATGYIQKNKIGTTEINSITTSGLVINKSNWVVITGNTFKNLNPLAIPFRITEGVDYYIASNIINSDQKYSGDAISIRDIINCKIEYNDFINGNNGLNISSSKKLMIFRNHFNSITENAINLEKSTEVEISENTTLRLAQNAKPINLNYTKGSESNESIPVPVMSLATYKKGTLIIRGKTQAFGNIEIYETDTAGQDLLKFVTKLRADKYGDFNFVSKVLPENINDKTFRATNTIGAEFLTGGKSYYTSEASVPFNPHLKLCYVTTESDANEKGTFRYNLHLANKGECNLMLFEVPGDTLVSLLPDSSYPVIRAKNLTIDGTSQPGYKVNPAVVISDSKNFTNALQVKTKGVVAFHALRFDDYEHAIALDSAENFESSLSEFRNYTTSGIQFNSDISKVIYIDSCKFISLIPETGIRANKNRIRLRANTIQAGSKIAVSVEADSVSLESNIIGYTSPVTGAQAVKAEKIANLRLIGNKISDYPTGITGKNLNTVEIVNTSFPGYSKNKSLNNAVIIDSCKNTHVLGSSVSYSDNAIIIKNSPKAVCNGNTIQAAVKTGIFIEGCSKTSLDGNRILKSKAGIVLINSKSSQISNGKITNHDSAGVIIDKLSDSIVFTGNTIGSDIIEGSEYSRGAGLILYSSSNIIGKRDTAANVFSNNHKGGIIVDSGTKNKISYNIFFRNDSSETRPLNYAIKHLNNGNNLKNKPVINTFTIENKKGVFLVYGKAEPKDTVQIFRTDGYYQTARYFIGETLTDASGNWSIQIDTTDTITFRKPFKNKTITLAATATDVNRNTSELSEIFYMGTCFVTTNRDFPDNEYPYPNSFRQAVKCANTQPDKSSILFAINGFTGFDIALKDRMLPFWNNHGLEFNGANISNKSVPVKVFNADTTKTLFWEIADSAGPVSLKNLVVQNFDTSVYLRTSANTSVTKFRFLNSRNASVVLNNDSSTVFLDSLTMQDSPKSSLVNIGKAGKATIKNSSIQNAKSGIISAKSDSLIVQNNKFEKTKNILVIHNSGMTMVSSNNFGKGFTTGIDWKNTSGRIEKNIFESDTTALSLKISNSRKVNIVSNSFNGESKEVMNLYKTDSSLIQNNYAGFVKTYIANLDSCKHITIAGNNVEVIKKLGFNLLNSEAIKLSMNQVNASSIKTTGNIINLNKGTANSSNKSHREPEIKEYKVQKEKDCSQEHLGIYLFGTAAKKDYIEIIVSDSLTTTFSKYVGSVIADTSGNWHFRIPKELYQSKPSFKYSFTATGTDSTNNTSQESIPFRFSNVENRVAVKFKADTGEFTLRYAVGQINCSDIYTRVVFEIDELTTHRIILKDTLPVLNAFLGFSIDGSTQIAYSKKEKISGVDSLIYISGNLHSEKYPIFRVHEKTDSSEISSLTFEDATKGIALNNTSDKIKNLTIKYKAAKGDTALIVKGKGGHKISGSTIEGYKTGIALIDTTTSDFISGNTISKSTIAISVSENSFNNRIYKNTIQPESIGVLMKGVSKENYITSNTFGSVSTPVTNTCIKLQNAQSQQIEKNYMPAGKANSNQANIAFIDIADSSHNNNIVKNKIGIEKDGFTKYESGLIGIRNKPETAGLRNSNNIIEGNQIAGLTVPAIWIENANGGSVNANYIGIDSAYVQRKGKEDYSEVSGSKETPVLIIGSRDLFVNSNTIVNFGKYAIDLQRSGGVKMSANNLFSEKSKLKAINLNLSNPQLISNSGIAAPAIDSAEVISQDKIVLRGSTKYPNTRVELFEGFAYSDDTLDHSLRFIKAVEADGNGKFSVELPSSNFGFNKYNKYIVQVTDATNSSELGHLFTVVSLLCKLKEKNIDLINETYQPCPGSDFEVDAQLDGLIYKWSSPKFTDTIRTRIAKIDSSADVHLEISDQFKCKHEEDFRVAYKAKPLKPDFVVSSRNFVGDTIVLVDVSGNKFDEYYWSSSKVIAIVSEKNDTSKLIKGSDGKMYPGGKVVRFIVPDTGTYSIEQKSVLNGCHITISKDVHVEYKDPGQVDPYDPARGFKSLIVYPSPVTGPKLTNAFLTTTSKEEVKLELVDIGKGTVIYKAFVSGKMNYNLPLDLSTYAKGNYLVVVTTGNSVLTYKVLVE